MAERSRALPRLLTSRREGAEGRWPLVLRASLPCPEARGGSTQPGGGRAGQADFCTGPERERFKLGGHTSSVARTCRGR